jgi:lipopolysaccharide transport system ATP-binding protein
MSRPVIEVSAVSKHYVIQHESRHDNLRDTLHHTARKLWRRVRWGTGFETEEFWALRDISFSVQPGEVVGIIGRNGAGKSTLLKILSRITEPTSGRIALRGRVASLLEVGTGFHPDLTGRENIFLNGAILGMQRKEITRKFDEIVAFAEVERFLDTPVKRYSSGMYVRLAFAVAAHLEPEILIVDEVLAVGDAQFQKKCLGKLEEVAHQGGRTVLFVSHNLATISRLCSSAILLRQGQVAMRGTAMEAVARYLVSDDAQSTVFTPARPGSDAVSLLRAELVTGRPDAAISPGQAGVLVLRYQIHQRTENLRVGFRLQGQDGTVVLTSANTDTVAGAAPVSPAGPGTYETRCTIPAHWLNRGQYYFTLAADVQNQQVHFFYENALALNVDPALDNQPTLVDGRVGLLAPQLPWETNPISKAP